MKKADLFFNVLRLPMDFLMLLAAGATTYVFRTEILRAFKPGFFEFNIPLDRYLYLVVFVSFLFLVSYTISGLYSMKVRMGITEEFLKVLVSSSATVMTVIVYIFLRQELFNSRFLVLGGWFFAVLFVFMGRMLVRYLQVFFVSKYDFGVHRIMVVGNNQAAVNIIDEIIKNPSSGIWNLTVSGYSIFSDKSKFLIFKLGSRNRSLSKIIRILFPCQHCATKYSGVILSETKNH